MSPLYSPSPPKTGTLSCSTLKLELCHVQEQLSATLAQSLGTTRTSSESPASPSQPRRRTPGAQVGAGDTPGAGKEDLPRPGLSAAGSPLSKEFPNRKQPCVLRHTPPAHTS